MTSRGVPRRSELSFQMAILVTVATLAAGFSGLLGFEHAAPETVRYELLVHITTAFFCVLVAGGFLTFVLNRRHALYSKLHSNETRLELLIQHSPAAIAMFDTEMRYIMASDRWISDYGIKHDNIVGLSHYELFPEILERPDWLEKHRRALQGDIIQEDQDFWITADGKKEWLKYRIHPWIGEDGKIGGIIIFADVITSRKATEDALLESEKTFRMALQYAPIGIALVHPDGRFMKANDALCRLLGYSETELTNLTFQAITHPKDLVDDLGQVDRLFRGEMESFQIEKRYFHKDGHIVWALLSASLLRDEEGKPKYFISQIQDITEAKKIEEMKEDFISIIGHELKTPVTSISLSLDLLRSSLGETDDPHIRRIIAAAQSNSVRLTSLINDVLDLRRMSSGMMAYDIQKLDIGEVIKRSVQENEAYGRRFNVIFKTSDIPQGLLISADETRICQVLSNFLSNAAKFSPEGSEVMISATLLPQDIVRTCVKDHGPGIPSEFRNRIFQKFAQADSSISRQQEGTGLGLHISKEMIEKMGGKIGYESVPGQGSSFWFDFPQAT